jgi:hypothetical protein
MTDIAFECGDFQLADISKLRQPSIVVAIALLTVVAGTGLIKKGNTMTLRLFWGGSLPAIAIALAPLTAVAQAKSWKCSATGLVSGSYDGGATAYIHLQGFSSGGTYSVTRKGNVATGVTANGTRFTCKLS